MVIRDKLHYENKISLLITKGEVQNDALIKKCKRKIYQLEKANA